MATYKELMAADIKTSRSVLNQLVDVVQEDISGSATRKKYQVFVTGGVGPGVTSSLFQTVYDQSYALQTANPIFDVTFGIYSGSGINTGSTTGQDSAGKLLYPSTSLMMREKVDVYRQFAQLLLGNATHQFSTPFGISQPPAKTKTVDSALFICFKRLFARDKIKRESFAMRFYTSASGGSGHGGTAPSYRPFHELSSMYSPNLNSTSVSGSYIFTDVGSAKAREVAVGGEVGNLVMASNTANYVGLIFYDHGIAVLNTKKIISSSQHVTGIIDAMSAGAFGGASDVPKGKTVIGFSGHSNQGLTKALASTKGNPDAKFVPDFVVSASMDNILDHFCSARFSSGSNTAVTFQNITNINSTLIFCRATSDEFNYSSNPTFRKDDGSIRVIDDVATDRSFSFVTTIGLYDALNNLLAVAKLSRPVEKNDEKDLTFRIRLDF